MGIGPWHLLILVGIIAVLFMPKRVANLGVALKHASRNFKKGLNEDDAIDVTHSHREKREQLDQPANQASNHQTKDRQKGRDS